MGDCLPLVRLAGGPVALAAGGHSGAQGTQARAQRQTADRRPDRMAKGKGKGSSVLALLGLGA